MVFWVITAKTKDHPHSFVTRRWRAKGQGQVPDLGCGVFDTLEEAREAIPPGFRYQAPSEADDPVIVEFYIPR